MTPLAENQFGHFLTSDQPLVLGVLDVILMMMIMIMIMI